MAVQSGTQPYSLLAGAAALPEPESASRSCRELLRGSLPAEPAAVPAPEPFDMFGAAQPSVPPAGAGAVPAPPAASAAEDTSRLGKPPNEVAAAAEGGNGKEGAAPGAEEAMQQQQPFELKWSSESGETRWTKWDLDQADVGRDTW